MLRPREMNSVFLGAASYRMLMHKYMTDPHVTCICAGQWEPEKRAFLRRHLPTGHTLVKSTLFPRHFNEMTWNQRVIDIN